ncbi:MAG: glycoside hydrolase family 3 protein [Lachnospiraceae bacterium]|nr:glycoside hydrolase family 3 protein [Lachnospiraceae bacterium]
MFKKKNRDPYEDEQYEEEFDEIEQEDGAEESYEDEAEEIYEDGAEGGAEEAYEDEAEDDAEEVYEDEAEDGAEAYADDEDGLEESYVEEDAENGDYSEERSAKRVIRRKRRIRNQIIAYIVLLMIVAGLACGALFAGKQLVRFIDERRAAKPVEEDVPPPDVIAVNSPTTTPEPEPEPVIDPVDEVARYYIAQMTTEEKVAGLFFVTPESMMENVTQAVRAGAKTQEALDQYAVGGLIYFGSNIQSADQITEMLAGTQEMSKYPLFFGVDEEGGSVSRVADSLSEVHNVGSARELGASGDGGSVYIAYAEIGQYLAKYGFNVNFAPVADIYDGQNSMFAERSFGTEADTVAMLVSQAVMGLQENGVSACVKHFPGHGSTDADSHNGRATNEMTEADLLETEVIPFQMAIQANPDFIMVSHISVPGITWDYTPASMSSDVVTRILRMQLGYEGIIITDAMDMGAITTYYTSAQAAVDAINAGCDMILKPDNFKEAYQGVLDAVNSGEISIERIEESLMRIYRVKCAGMTLADVPGGVPADQAGGTEDPEAGDGAEGGAGEGEGNGGDDGSLLPEGE